MSVDWTTTDACERCDEHSSGEAARGLHRAWHAVVAALMEAVRIPQLVGWLARRHDVEVAARAWDEGERHENTYLARTDQFCPHGTACNPYRNERECGQEGAGA